MINKHIIQESQSFPCFHPREYAFLSSPSSSNPSHSPHKEYPSHEQPHFHALMVLLSQSPLLQPEQTEESNQDLSLSLPEYLPSSTLSYQDLLPRQLDPLPLLLMSAFPSTHSKEDYPIHESSCSIPSSSLLQVQKSHEGIASHEHFHSPFVSLLQVS